MSNVSSQVFFLKTSRAFPEESVELIRELTKAYIDTANAVNARTIGSFTVNTANQNGENWYLQSNKRQQGFRKTFVISSFSSFNHNVSGVSRYVKIYGTFTDGTNWYPLPYVDGSSTTANIGVKVTSSQVQFTVGGTAPSITTGTIVLEWIANP